MILEKQDKFCGEDNQPSGHNKNALGVNSRAGEERAAGADTPEVWTCSTEAPSWRYVKLTITAAA